MAYTDNGRRGSSRRGMSGRGSSRATTSRSLSGVAGRPTNYTVHRRSINFNNRGPAGFFSRFEPRELAIMVGALVVLIILIVAIASCARGCSKAKEEQAVTTETNSQDSRVAAGVSSEVTSQLSTVLDRDDKISTIAANANQYTDTRLITLALTEPTAVNFVANYPTADKSSAAYTDTVAKGSYPLLYTWDQRWGNVDYAGSAFAVTGSGPTCLSIAYMGIVGNGDKTPADIATLATADGLATGDEGTSGDFFTKEATGLSLKCTKYDSSEDELVTLLSAGDVVIVQVKANTITTQAHWAIVVGRNSNGSAVLYDPTSTAASSHEWDTATIASDASALYAVGAKS